MLRLKYASSMTISSLNLSVRTNRCLHSISIESVADLLEKTPNELLKINTFGKKCLSNIECKCLSIQDSLQKIPLGEIIGCDTTREQQHIIIAQLPVNRRTYNYLSSLGILNLGTLLERSIDDIFSNIKNKNKTKDDIYYLCFFLEKTIGLGESISSKTTTLSCKKESSTLFYVFKNSGDALWYTLGMDERLLFSTMNIMDFNLSKRLQSCIFRLGIKTVGDLMSTPCNRICENNAFGKVCFDELLFLCNQIATNAILSLDKDISFLLDPSLKGLFSLCIEKAKGRQYDYSRLPTESIAYIEDISDAIDFFGESLDLDRTDIISFVPFYIVFKKRPFLKKLGSDKMYRNLKARPFFVEFNAKNGIDNIPFDSQTTFNDILSLLTNCNKHRIDSNTYEYICSFLNWMYLIKDINPNDVFNFDESPYRDIVQKRLDGHTLAELADERGLSKTRIYLIVLKECKKMVKKYKNSAFDFVLHTSALRNGKKILSKDDFYEIDSKSVDILWLAASYRLLDCSLYHFDNKNGHFKVVDY